MQLYKIYGKGKDAKAFVDELVKGPGYTMFVKCFMHVVCWCFIIKINPITWFPVHPNLTGQVGIPHPQCPNLESAKMFKVLREVVEDTSTGSRSNLDIGTGGRVRDGKLKGLIAKQLNVGLQQLENQPQMDLKTGRIHSKKAKKEKPAEKLALDAVKTLANKFHTQSMDAYFHNINNNQL